MGVNIAKPVIIYPTLREKKRYVAFEVINDNETDILKVKAAIQNSITTTFGVEGASRFGVWVMKDHFNHAKKVGLIRVNHRYVDQLKAAFSMITRIDNKQAIIQTIGVSGILNKAVERYLN